MPQNQEEIKELWAKLVAQSWEDANLRKRMLDEPAEVLKENGVQVPDGFRVQAFEDDGQTIVLPVNVKPAEEELSDEQLESVAGGIGLNEATSTIGSLKGLELLEVVGPCVTPKGLSGPCDTPGGTKGLLGPCD